MLASVAVAVAVGFGVVAPAIPVFAHSFGVGNTAVGAVISAFALMRFVSAMACGRLVDAVGERIILTVGIGIVAVSTGLAGLSQSYVQLLVLRGIGGVGSAMFTVSALALLFRVVDGANRGRATGLFQQGFLIGGLLGPVVGGYLTGISLRLPFYVYAISLIAAGAIGAVFLRGTEERPLPARPATAVTEAEAESAVGTSVVVAAELAEEPSDEEPSAEPIESTTVSTALAHPSYRAAVAVNFAVGWALFGVRFSLIPLYVTEGMGLHPKWIGYGLLCSSLAQVASLAQTGPYVDRAGRRPAMVIGTLICGAALVSLSVSTSLLIFLAAMTATGIGTAFLGTAPGAVVGDIMHGRGGRVVAVFQMASDAGQITGPLVAGWLADQVSFGAGFAAGAVVLFVATGLSLRMPETLASKVRPLS